MVVGIRSCVWEAFDYMAGRHFLADIMLNGLLPERLGRSHTVQLCEGLLYLDFKHVVHRDMKPKTWKVILLTEMKILMFFNSGTLRSLRGAVHHQKKHRQYQKKPMSLLTVGSINWKRTASRCAIDAKNRKLFLRRQYLSMDNY